ncbi:hypothetical protein KQI84_08530 [bacterium]|nr:hypothetical protein [bacterium]
MSRLLILGVGPRPAPAARQVFAPGLRLATMIHELAADGHEIAVGEFLFGGAEKAAEDQSDGVARHEFLPSDIPQAADRIAALAREHNADAVVALTDVAALAAVRSEFDGPLYIDYNGHPMAERQMQAEVHGSNAALHDQWLYVLPVLVRADMFGVCSGAQRYALLGELGAAGRLNAATCGHELVQVLPVVLPFDEPFRSSQRGYLRGGIVPEDARIILFTGGYNTWLDEATLFEAVERVLANDPQAVYVTTGGEIEGHVNKVFRNFRARVEKSPHRDRYHFLGWIEHDRFIDCCLEADVGVSCDRWTLEGELGCRNRLFGWLWAGMRAVMNDPTEITAEFADAGLIATARAGDAADFAEKLGTELRLGRFDEQEAERRREKLHELRGAGKCYEPLRNWAKNPQPAPDRVATGQVENPLVNLQREFLNRDETVSRDVEELVQRLSGSRAFGVYENLHPDVRRLLERIRSRIESKKE